MTVAVIGAGDLVAQQPASGPAPSAPRFFPGTITPNASTQAVYSTTSSPVRAAAPAVPPTGRDNSASGDRPKFADTPVKLTGGSETIKPILIPGTQPELVPLPPIGTEMRAAPAMPSIGSIPSITAERASVPIPSGKAADLLPGLVPPASSAASIPLPGMTPAAPTLPSLMTTIPSTGNLSSRQSPTMAVEYEMPESVGVGQLLVYHVVVKNLGTSAVNSVRIEQEQPTGTQYISSEPSAENQAENRLGWTIGTLEAGAEKRIKVTVKPSEEGEIRGRANVSFVSAVEAKVKVTRPKINIAMTAIESARVGDKVTVNIKLTNTGSGPASSITLQARLTDGLSHPAGAVVEAPLANLAAGATITRNLEITAAKSGAQQVTLAVFADANPAESAKVGILLVEPQLQAKQAGPAKCFVKGEPTYTIELANPGTTVTDAITMWTMLPDGFEFVSATEGGTFSPTHKAVIWKLSGLSAGSNKSIGVKVRSMTPTDGVIRTLVQSGAVDQASTGPANKPRLLEAKCETPVKAEGMPALRFEVIDVEDPVELGKEALYEIKVTNQGTGPCTNIAIVAELGEGTVAGSTSGPSNGKPSGNTIVFDTLVTLPVKGEAMYKVRVKGTVAGDSRFRVKLTSDQIKSPIIKEENTRFYKE